MTSECGYHEGKVAYHSRGLARAALDTIRRHGEKREKKPVRSYECPTCHRHFLTSLPEFNRLDDD